MSSGLNVLIYHALSEQRYIKLLYTSFIFYYILFKYNFKTFSWLIFLINLFGSVEINVPSGNSVKK